MYLINNNNIEQVLKKFNEKPQVALIPRIQFFFLFGRTFNKKFLSLITRDKSYL